MGICYMKYRAKLSGFFIIMVALGVTYACNPKVDTVQQSGSDASQPIGPDLDKEAFARGIKQSGAVIIDLRFPAEYEKGHIDGAINLNFFDPEFRYKLLDLNRKKKYYLYDQNDNDLRVSTVHGDMIKNDFTEVYILKGGYVEWIKN